MCELMEITLDPAIRNNPQKVGELIFQLAEDIEACKKNLSGIMNRDFFKRVCSNNTCDLEDAMLKQNDTITLFVNIVQSLILLNLNNTVILTGIQDELTKHQKGRGNLSNKYIEIAKEYIAQSIEFSRKVIEKID